MRMKKLEDEMEEFKCGITEENLRLKVPYITDNQSNGLGLSVSAEDNKILYVYLKGELIGQITLE